MKKWQIAGLVVIVVLLAGIVVAEQMTFSTYYPAPAGRYREFSTTGRTTLATNEFGIETDEYARVGIGTTDPQALLHMRRDQNDATTFFIDNKQSGSESQARLYIQSLDGGGLLTYRDEAFTAFSRTHLADRFELRADGGSSGLTLMSAKVGSDIRFYTDGDTPEHERMRITSAGNVGIGTTNPGAKLEVDGDILSDTVGYDSEGAYRYCKIDGNKTKIYTKYLTGTLDNDASTNIAHGCTASKILSVITHVADGVSSYYPQNANAGSVSYEAYFNATNVIIGTVRAPLQGQGYKIKIDYIL